MKKLVLSAAVAALTSVTAQAYQFEVGAALISPDEGDDSFVFHFDYHFNDVDNSKGPLNEANFLDKSSYVSIIADDEGDATFLRGRFVLDGDWTLEGSVGDVDDATPVSLYIGKYLSDNSEVQIVFRDPDTDEDTEFGVAYKSVTDSLGWDAEVTTVDSEFFIDLGAIFYVDNTLGFGGGLEYNSITEDVEFNLEATYFITEEFEVEFVYLDEVETFAIGANYRF